MLAPIEPITNTCPPNRKWWKKLTKTDVGLSNVDNTSDMDKPISIAVQRALDEIDARHLRVDEVNTFTALQKFNAGIKATDVRSTGGLTTDYDITCMGDMYVAGGCEVDGLAYFQSKVEMNEGLDVVGDINLTGAVLSTGAFNIVDSSKNVKAYLGYDSNNKNLYVTNTDGPVYLFATNNDVHVQSPSVNSDSSTVVNKDWIWKTDANADNGLVHREATEDITGLKRFNAPLQVKSDRWSARTDYKSSGYTAMDINFIVANNDAVAKLRFFETATERGVQVGVWSNALNDMSWTTIGRVVK